MCVDLVSPVNDLFSRLDLFNDHDIYPPPHTHTENENDMNHLYSEIQGMTFNQWLVLSRARRTN